MQSKKSLWKKKSKFIYQHLKQHICINVFTSVSFCIKYFFYHKLFGKHYVNFVLVILTLTTKLLLHILYGPVTKIDVLKIIFWAYLNIQFHRHSSFMEQKTNLDAVSGWWRKNHVSHLEIIQNLTTWNKCKLYDCNGISTEQ